MIDAVHPLLAIPLALGAAVLAAVGTVMRHRATTRVGSLSRAWFVGAVVSAVAFALQVAALVFGSVLLVQPLIVLSVLFELLFEAWRTKRSPGRRQWAFAAAVAAGVAALVVFARPVPARMGRQEWVLDVAVFGFLAVLLVLYQVARRTTGDTSGVLFGLISGALFGLVAVQINGLSAHLDDVASVARNPSLYVCIASAGCAIAAQQRAFAGSRLRASYPAMVAGEPVVSMALSMAVVGEKLSSHSLGSYVGVAGLVVMVVGVVGLARTNGAAVDQEADAGGPDG